MKITKRQLRRIIKEEKVKLLNEGFRMPDIAREAADALRNVNPDRLEDLQRTIADALIPESDLRAWNELFDAMIEAAYLISEHADYEDEY